MIHLDMMSSTSRLLYFAFLLSKTFIPCSSQNAANVPYILEIVYCETSKVSYNTFCDSTIRSFPSKYRSTVLVISSFEINSFRADISAPIAAWYSAKEPNSLLITEDDGKSFSARKSFCVILPFFLTNNLPYLIATSFVQLIGVLKQHSSLFISVKFFHSG